MKRWTPKDILKLRDRHDISQSAFGRLLGVTGNYVYLLEKGVKNPSATLRLLLDCVERQLNEKGEKTNDKRHL